MRSVKKPVSGMKMAEAIRYEVSTQLMLSGVASSCPAMLGSATLMMVVSSTCMMVAAITATPVNIRLRLMAVLFQLHAHSRRRADAQRMFSIHLGKLDAHRHTLRDLHPVAGGVLRRQQREGRAGAAAQTFHRAFEMLTRVHVDLDVHVLSWMDADQFGLFEIGVDMETVLRNEREQRSADADQRAWGEREVADLSVLRCGDMSVCQIELGLINGSLCLQHVTALFGLYRCGERLGQFGARLFQRCLQCLHSSLRIIEGLLRDEMLSYEFFVARVNGAGVGKTAPGLRDQRTRDDDFRVVLARGLSGERQIGPRTL